jgi:galactose mutarotase-like enzyme
MSFDAGDASGWDECLPSVAACTVPTAGGTALVPDHGDLWRVAWESQGSGNREEGTGNTAGKSGQAHGSDPAPISLLGECFSLPLELERTLSLREVDGGWRLNLDYTLTNMGDHPVPWSWAAHPLFAVEPGDRIVLPQSIQTLSVQGSGGGRLGKKDDTSSLAGCHICRRRQRRSDYHPIAGIGHRLQAVCRPSG